MTKTERFFVSKAGSKVRIFGKHLGAYEIDWDWFEEGVCDSAHPSFNMDFEEPVIEASCECCPDSPWTIPLHEEKKVTEDQEKRELYWLVQNLVQAIDAAEDCSELKQIECRKCDIATLCQKKSMRDRYLDDARGILEFKTKESRVL